MEGTTKEVKELEESANDELWMFPHDGYDYSQHIRELGGGIFLELVWFSFFWCIVLASNEFVLNSLKDLPQTRLRLL